MIASHIHHALDQVRDLQRLVAESQRFTGYSGRVRAVGGTVALIGAVVMSRGFFPATVEAHLIGWAVVLGVAVVANYSAVLHWFLFQPEVRRDPRRLMPTVDALPSLFVGGLLTVVLLIHGEHDLLFGTWMCLYGLTNLSSRRVLPRAIWPLGLFYIACGTACLFAPWISFENPWPMAIVFCAGEWIGGFIFHHNRRPEASLTSFFGTGGHRDGA